MEAENGKTMKVFIRTNHIETERSRCTAKPGKISEGGVSKTGDPRTDLLWVAQGVWGNEHDPGKKAKNPGKRKHTIEEFGSRPFIG